jgi:hypothetical protein
MVSIGVAFMAAILPESRLVYSDPHGYARLLTALQGGSPLAATFPTFTETDWWTPFIGLLPWFAAGVLGLATIAFASRAFSKPTWGPPLGGPEVRLKPDATSYSLWAGLAGALVFLLVAGVGTASPDTPIRDEIAQRGALELLWRWDPGRVRAFEYGRNVPLSAAHLRDLSVVSWRGPAAPVALPAGAYEARVWFAGAAAREGEIVVTSQQNAVFGRFAGALQNPTSIPFELPSDAPSVVVKLRDPKLAERVVNTEIVPHDVSSLSARDRHTVRAVDSVVDSTHGYIVYVDSTTFPEGGVFWTRGADLATVLVAPGGASRLVLTLFPGPLSGDVRVSVAGTPSKVRVEANQIAQFETDLTLGIRLVPVEIQAPGQFRPNEVDSNSHDTRRLGVQVRVGLQ